MASLSESKEQLYDDVERLLVNELPAVEVGSQEALDRFIAFAKDRIALYEDIKDPERIQLLNVRFADDRISIVFNGYRILPKR